MTLGRWCVALLVALMLMPTGRPAAPGPDPAPVAYTLTADGSGAFDEDDDGSGGDYFLNLLPYFGNGGSRGDGGTGAGTTSVPTPDAWQQMLDWLLGTPSTTTS